LEQQLLLKEVRIGRRSQELPSWTGVVRGAGDGAAAASASASAAGVGQAAAAEEAVDAGLKALFVQNGLGAVCADVCRTLGVECLDDLKLVEPQDLIDELPKYVQKKLTVIQKRKLAAMIEGQRTVAGGSEAVVQGEVRQKRSVPDEILALFREKGLNEVLCEFVCRKLGASTVEDLRLVQDSDIDYLKGVLDLEPITIRKLRLLVKEVSAAARSSNPVVSHGESASVDAMQQGSLGGAFAKPRSCPPRL
jgi:hypothetical protein